MRILGGLVLILGVTALFYAAGGDRWLDPLIQKWWSELEPSNRFEAAVTEKLDSEALLAAESALAGPGTLLLLHLDVERALALERAVLGEQDEAALMPPLLRDHQLQRAMREAGIDPRESLQEMQIAVVAEGDAVGFQGVALGAFELTPIRDALQRLYEVSELEVAGQPVLRIRGIDPDTCEEEEMLVHLGEGRIEVATPGAMAGLLRRLQSPEGPVLDLDRWRAFRAGRLLSLGLFAAPRDVGSLLPGPFGAIADQKAKQDLAEVEELFAGLSGAADPFSLTLAARIETSDAAWVAGTARSFEGWRESLKEDFAEQLPSLARLQEFMELHTDGQRLDFAVAFDQAMMAEVERLPGELLTLMFQGLGSTSSDAVQQPESILEPEQVARYRSHTGHSELQAFDPQFDQSFDAQATSGPFGLAVKSLSLGEENAIEIELEATSVEIPNLLVASLHSDDEAAYAKLFVTEVAATDGRDLLDHPDCGPWRADLAGILEPRQSYVYRDDAFVPVPMVRGGKRLRLVEGAEMADIAAIKGRIELTIPSEVETKRLSLPLDGETVEGPDLRVAFDGAANGEVRYEISGRKERLLDLRALNATGDYLAPAGGFASDRLLGVAKSVAKTFQGEPATVELVIATAEETKSYEFTLSPVEVLFDRWDIPKPHKIEPLAEESLRAAYPDWAPEEAICQEGAAAADMEPLYFCLEEIQSAWGGTLQARFRLAAPPSPVLRKNLAAVEVLIEEVSAVGLDDPVAVTIQEYPILTDSYGSEQLDSSSIYAYSQSDVAALEGREISSARGRLRLVLPTRLAERSLPVDRLGAVLEVPEAANGAPAWSLRLLAIEEGGFRLAYRGARQRLLQVVPLDGSGTVLATSSEAVEFDDDTGAWILRFRSSGRPAALQVLTAAQSQVEEYPFDLRLGP